jgi:hypothetical protein
MANPTVILGMLGHRVDEALMADDTIFKPTKAYAVKETGEAQDDTSLIAGKTELLVTFTRVKEFEYVVIVEKDLSSPIDYNRIYITNANDKTILAVDYNLIEGATDIHNSFIYKLKTDCGVLQQ